MEEHNPSFLDPTPGATMELVRAIRARDVRQVRDLIASGASPTGSSPTGRTFLHLAAEEGDVAIAEVLLDSGLPVSARTKEQDTPLHFAARYGRHGRCDWLLDDLEFKQGSPWERRLRKPVPIATARAILEVLRRRNPQFPTELGPEDEIPAGIKGEVFVSLLEVMTDRTGLLADLEDAGVALETLDPEFIEQLNGYPRYLAMAQLLIERGAEVSVLNEFGETPLHLAIQAGELAMVDLLLKGGADPNLRAEGLDRRCTTPMQEAIDYYRKDAAELLHAHGAHIDFEGLLPLHTAACNGQVELMLWLLRVGGDINSQDAAGDTPIMAAAASGHDNAVQLLLERNAELVQRNKRGQGVLHFAAAWNPCLKPLLGHGLDVNARENDGLAPMHYAARSIDERSIRLLASAGADVNAQDKDGNTPLHIIFFGEEFRPDIEMPTFEALVAAGADRSRSNHQGQTPFDLATIHGYPKPYLDLLKPT